MRTATLRVPADLVLAAALGACRGLAWPIAAAKQLALRYREAVALQWLSRRPEGAGCAFRHVAFTRLARQVMKLFLLAGEEASVFRRVHCEGLERLPFGGCVLAIAHTPWGRVLARWSLSCDFAFILAHRRWAHWAGALHLLPTPSGQRRAVQELRRGRRVVVVIDDFVPSGGCAVEFLGRPARVTMRAARLAALAGVPVVPVTLRYRHGLICLEFGTPLSSNCGRRAHEQMTRALCAGVDHWVNRFPEEWNDLFEYFAGKTELGVSTRVETSLGWPGLNSRS
jgi:lipid A biosynthesis acyltransferase